MLSLKISITRVSGCCDLFEIRWPESLNFITVGTRMLILDFDTH